MSGPARSGERTPDCTIVLDGESIPAVAGEPVAVSLFAARTKVLSRSIKFHRPRSFFCLSGHCGACLMRVDGKPNVKACRAPCSDGLRVERQNAFPSGKFDLLGAADFFFPKGMDHHTMFTSPRVVNTMMQKMVRQLGGLGKLPDPALHAPSLPRGKRRHVDVAIIGGGPAGLQAAIACAKPGRKVVVYDEQDRPGGSMLSHPAFGPRAADALSDEARAAGVEICCNAATIAWYPEDEQGLLAVDDNGTLVRLTAERYLYATGAYDVNALFTDNDRPGIFAARAVGALWVRWGVRPAQRPLILGDGPYARALAEALEGAGCQVLRVDGTREQVTGAHGSSWVTALDVASTNEAGKRATKKVKCDLVAVAALPAPASELPRQQGAKVVLSPEAGGFACVVDGAGRTTSDRVFACGDVCGFKGVEAARAHGATVGKAIAESLSP
jgi:sarcosine oxidase subunit alpha